MTANEKRKFIVDLMASMTDDMLAKVPQMPEDWDGNELRQYITDTVADRAVLNKMDRIRMRQYRNDAIVNNL